jgi:capsular exopolysaccharide synthesis family protein
MENFTPPLAPGNHDEGKRLRISWHVVMERRWLILTVVCLSILLSLLSAFRATPIYESVAVVQVDPESSGVLALRERVSFTAKDVEYFRTQEQNLRSPTLIGKVAEQLKLKQDPRYQGQEDFISAVTRDITIDPIRQTRLIRVRVLHPKRETACSMANTLVKLFLDDNIKRKRDRSEDGYKVLLEANTNAANDLNIIVAELTKYREDKGSVSLSDDADVDTKTYFKAKEEYEASQAKSERLRKTTEEAKRWKSEGKDIAEFSPIAQDDTFKALKLKLGTLESEFAAIQKRYRPRHQKYSTAEAAVTNLQQTLKAEAQRVYDNLTTDAELQLKVTQSLFEAFQTSEKKVVANKNLKVDYDMLTRRKLIAENTYQQLNTKLKDFDLARTDVIQNISLNDPATPGIYPVKPRKLFILAGGVFGGVAVAFSLAFLLNHMDDSVKSQEDVENYLRLPFLGYIPNIKTTSVVERDLQAHLHPTSSAAEGFRTLRASVALARNADKLRNIAVSSTIPSEGKSLVASNFAIVTAQTGLKTLLVDADLRRPSVHKAFQLQSPVGLASYLAERVRSVDEIIHSTDIQNLDVVCCGALPSNPSELVGSKRMMQVLEEVSKRYDRVVLDCPPISAVADPLVVSAMCDGLLFVTKFNKIRREHALRSVQRIHDAGIHTIGLVLNDIDFEGKDSYYYSYHYYQNRYYSSHYRNKSADEPADKKPASATGKSA